MTFNSAISNLRDGYCAKRPSWRGYIECKSNMLSFAQYALASSKTVDQLTDDEKTQATEAIRSGWKVLVFHLADGTTTVPYVIDEVPSNDMARGGAGHSGEVVEGTGTTAKTMYQDYVPLTTFLLNAILQEDWETGTLADFQLSAAGGLEY